MDDYSLNATAIMDDCSLSATVTTGDCSMSATAIAGGQVSGRMLATCGSVASTFPFCRRQLWRGSSKNKTKTQNQDQDQDQGEEQGERGSNAAAIPHPPAIQLAACRPVVRRRHARYATLRLATTSTTTTAATTTRQSCRRAFQRRSRRASSGAHVLHFLLAPVCHASYAYRVGKERDRALSRRQLLHRV
ncbi:hypothetical protein BKA80DRAFT_70557 [Phyllosticta citrichinensis]